MRNKVTAKRTICLAVTKSGMGTWFGMRRLGAPGHRDAGMWDSGTWGRGEVVWTLIDNNTSCHYSGQRHHRGQNVYNKYNHIPANLGVRFLSWEC